jgi:hypothetical protein
LSIQLPLFSEENFFKDISIKITQIFLISIEMINFLTRRKLIKIMFRVPLTRLPLQKKKLLADSQTRPSIYISIEQYHFDEQINAVVYDCHRGIQENTDVVIHVIKTRFFQLAKLDKVLRLAHPNMKSVKQFPRKQWLGNRDQIVLEEGRHQLQEYLSSLTHVRGLLREESFRKCTKLPI